MRDDELDFIILKCRLAKKGHFKNLSTTEKLAAAMVWNRPDWLASTGYTFAEAIDRLGPKWLARIPAAERVLREEAERVLQEEEASNSDA